MVAIGAVLPMIGPGDGLGTQAAPTPVEITGSGTWSANAFMTALADPLYASGAPTTLSYLAKGSRDGQTRLRSR